MRAISRRIRCAHAPRSCPESTSATRPRLRRIPVFFCCLRDGHLRPARRKARVRGLFGAAAGNPSGGLPTAARRAASVGIAHAQRRRILEHRARRISDLRLSVPYEWPRNPIRCSCFPKPTPRASRSTTTAPIPFAPAASVFMRISAMRSCTAWKSFAREVCGHAVQLMGGYGYSREYGMERRLRDSWGWGIAGGAIDIQKTTSRAQ